jgi:tetratricopeptide (TPR) repeat protein
MFEIKVTQIVIDTSRLNPYFTLQKAVNRKTMANDIYQHEWCPPPTSETDPSCDAAMARALRLYQAAAKDMETLLDGTYFNQVEEDHPQRGQSTQILLDSLNNIVAVYLRQKEFHKAKQAAVEVLKQDPKNVKALLRAAKASLLDSASTMEEVEASLDAAEEEITYKDQQSEKELKRLKTELKRKKKEYKMKSKEMFADKLKTKASSEESAESSKKTSSTTETTKSGTSEEIQGTADTLDENSSEETKGEVAFWKSQLVPILIQVFIPLAIFLLYRFMSKANSIAQLSMASEDDDMSSAGEESGDTINLDL